VPRVEEQFLEKTNQRLIEGEDERIGVVVVGNFPTLGTLTAVRFIEWVQENPDGVVSLPTGKTPEYFIREVRRLTTDWSSGETRRELEQWGIDPATEPLMNSLRFVQIDEFYPINPRHTNSFNHYVKRFYLEGFGIPEEQAMLIDCEEIGIPDGTSLEDVWENDEVDLSLRYRRPRSERERMRRDVILRVDEWTSTYENRIQEMGGIGFFLGGIGPDGHIAFNVAGSDHHSTTRLSEINYETQAASAGDLGGIEVAKKRLVITVGLATITHNPQCTAIIMAAGEAKAGVVAEAVCGEVAINRPASALRVLPNARFYLTEGAARDLRSRRLVRLTGEAEITDEEVQRIIVDLSLRTNTPLDRLSDASAADDPFVVLACKRTGHSIGKLARQVREDLVAKIVRGRTIKTGKRFLHTEPHHDDIMLGYLPFVVRHIREHTNYHFFATFTSGFTAVTNHYMLRLYTELLDVLRNDTYSFRALADQGYFDSDEPRYRDQDVWTYLDGLAAESVELQMEGTLRRCYRDLIEVFEDSDAENLLNRVEELVNYFQTQYPGKKDLPYIQTLKGMCREWESECLWGYFGWDSSEIAHLRQGFYQGEIFTEEPTVRRDVRPVLELLERVRPDVVTVAFDPEASGPDTHYKVLQSLAEALRIYAEKTGRDDLEVLGYRNVWYRFHPSEANIFVPVSLNMMTLQHQSFVSTYLSQADASFPSHEYEGPFSGLAQRIQVEQYQKLTTLLGRQFFYDHDSALVRATRGFVFARSMTVDEFLGYSRELKSKAEADG
jgi:glucosamine-6-phosphate deaminase